MYSPMSLTGFKKSKMLPVFLSSTKKNIIPNDLLNYFHKENLAKMQSWKHSHISSWALEKFNGVR